MPINNKAHFKPDSSNPDPEGLAFAGPMLDVVVEVQPALAQAMQKAGKRIPDPLRGLALVDTGASASAVDDGIAKELLIQPVGTHALHGVGGAQSHFRYPVRLRFPGSRMPDLVDRIVFGADLASQKIPAYPNQRMIVLLGRDILKDFVLIYHGQLGMFTLAH